MTIFTRSTSETIQEPDADDGIMTAYIDVKGGVGENGPAKDTPWYARIAVYGHGVAGAEALRDEVLAALQLRQLIKETLA